MKVYAHYDSTGTIHSLIAVDAPEGVYAMLQSEEPGVLVDEVEGVEIEPGAPDLEAIDEIFENYKVASTTSRPRKLDRK